MVCSRDKQMEVWTMKDFKAGEIAFLPYSGEFKDRLVCTNNFRSHRRDHIVREHTDIVQDLGNSVSRIHFFAWLLRWGAGGRGPDINPRVSRGRILDAWAICIGSECVGTSSGEKACSHRRASPCYAPGGAVIRPLLGMHPDSGHPMTSLTL